MWANSIDSKYNSLAGSCSTLLLVCKCPLTILSADLPLSGGPAKACRFSLNAFCKKRSRCEPCQISSNNDIQYNSFCGWIGPDHWLSSFCYGKIFMATMVFGWFCGCSMQFCNFQSVFLRCFASQDSASFIILQL